jgi:ABC-type long-subunit fatty acid transport system fused permease/ATPase subunit
MPLAEPLGRPPAAKQNIPWADTVFSLLAHGAAILTLLLLAGIIGSYAESLGELTIFGGLAVTLFLFAVVLWTLSGLLVRWMHGAEDVKTA